MSHRRYPIGAPVTKAVTSHNSPLMQPTSSHHWDGPPLLVCIVAMCRIRLLTCGYETPKQGLLRGSPILLWILAAHGADDAQTGCHHFKRLHGTSMYLVVMQTCLHLSNTPLHICSWVSYKKREILKIYFIHAPNNTAE